MNAEILQEDVRLFAERFELADQLRGKTFLVTGATGLIGSVLVKCLLELNKKKNIKLKVIAVVRSREKALAVFGEKSTNLEIVVTELSGIGLESHSLHADYVVHLASPTASKYFVEKPVETLRTAIEGTTSLLEYAKKCNVDAMVYASSLEVYGRNYTDDLIKEDFQGYVDPLEVRSSYNIGKRTCECLCHSYAEEYGINVMIARFTQVFGAGISAQENRVFAQFARSVIEGKNIELHTEGRSAKPYCYTTDAVSAILCMLLKGEKGAAYNIANKDSYISIKDMACLVRDGFNSSIDVLVVPTENLGYAPETRLKLDTTKITELGWSPQYELKEMYRRTIKYLK